MTVEHREPRHREMQRSSGAAKDPRRLFFSLSVHQQVDVFRQQPGHLPDNISPQQIQQAAPLR